MQVGICYLVPARLFHPARLLDTLEYLPVVIKSYILATFTHLILYSMVSNNRAGWNKRVGGQNCQKLIIVQDGIIVQAGHFLKI